MPLDSNDIYNKLTRRSAYLAWLMRFMALTQLCSVLSVDMGLTPHRLMTKVTPIELLS